MLEDRNIERELEGLIALKKLLPDSNRHMPCILLDFYTDQYSVYWNGQASTHSFLSLADNVYSIAKKDARNLQGTFQDRSMRYVINTGKQHLKGYISPPFINSAISTLDVIFVGIATPFLYIWGDVNSTEPDSEIGIVTNVQVPKAISHAYYQNISPSTLDKERSKVQKLETELRDMLSKYPLDSRRDMMANLI
jgi:hypothetical protein